MLIKNPFKKSFSQLRKKVTSRQEAIKQKEAKINSRPDLKKDAVVSNYKSKLDKIEFSLEKLNKLKPNGSIEKRKVAISIEKLNSEKKKLLKAFQDAKEDASFKHEINKKQDLENFKKKQEQYLKTRAIDREKRQDEIIKKKYFSLFLELEPTRQEIKAFKQNLKVNDPNVLRESLNRYLYINNLKFTNLKEHNIHDILSFMITVQKPNAPLKEIDYSKDISNINKRGERSLIKVRAQLNKTTLRKVNSLINLLNHPRSYRVHYKRELSKIDPSELNSFYKNFFNNSRYNENHVNSSVAELFIGKLREKYKF